MSPYITHWKPPKLHVRQNQFAAQLLLQLISLVGEWSALCGEYGTSQRSHKCWSQLGRAHHLSLPNGKSIRVWWRLLNRPACPVADRDGFCCCNNAAWLQLQLCCCSGRQIMPALKGSIDPSCFFLQMHKCFFQTKFSVFKKNPPLNHEWTLKSQLHDLWLNKFRMCLNLYFDFNTYQCRQNECFQLFRQILFTSSASACACTPFLSLCN